MSQPGCPPRGTSPKSRIPQGAPPGSIAKWGSAGAWAPSSLWRVKARVTTSWKCAWHTLQMDLMGRLKGKESNDWCLPTRWVVSASSELKAKGRSEWDSQESFGEVKFELPSRHPSRHVKEVTEHVGLKFRRVWAPGHRCSLKLWELMDSPGDKVRPKYEEGWGSHPRAHQHLEREHGALCSPKQNCFSSATSWKGHPSWFFPVAAHSRMPAGFHKWKEIHSIFFIRLTLESLSFSPWLNFWACPPRISLQDMAPYHG